MAAIILYAVTAVAGVGAVVSLTQKPIRVDSPKIDDLRVTGMEYGEPIPYVRGHPVIPAQIWWASDRRAIATTTSQGGKGGPTIESTTYTYEVDVLLGFTSNQMAALIRLWQTGRLDFNVSPGSSAAVISASLSSDKWRRLTVYDGNSSQLPDPTYEAAVGVGNAPPYRGRFTVFIEGLQLGGSGQIPNITAEITSSGIPAGIYSDRFVDGLTPYSVLSGSIARFSIGSSPYGNSMVVETIAGGSAVIQRTMSPAVSTVQISVKFKPNGGSNTCIEWNNASGVNQFSIRPAEGSSTPFRPRITGQSNVFTTLSASTLPNGFWYQLTVTIAPGILDGSSALLTKLDDGSVIYSGPLSGTYAALSLGRQRFINGNGGALESLGTVEYADFVAISSGSATITDETLQSVVSAICLRAGLQASEFDVTALSAITKPVRGLAISQSTSMREVLQILQSAYFFDAVLSDKLYFKPQGGAALATLQYDQLGASSTPGGDPDPFSYKPVSELELPGTWALTYMNSDADFTRDTQTADRIGSFARTTKNTELPLAFTAAEAKAIVDVWRDTAIVTAIGSGSIKLLMTHANKEPADVLNVVDKGGTTRRLKLLKLKEAQMVREFAFVFDDANVLTQAGTTSSDYTPSATVNAAADTVLSLMDIAILRDADNDAGYYAATNSTTSPWPGAKVFSSPDNATFEEAASVTESAVIGTCTTTLGTWAGGNVFDEANSVTVSIGLSTLSSDTRDNLLNLGKNAALVGNEIVQFRTAALVSAGIYKLTGLLRGRRGTEAAQSGHASSERFVLLTARGIRRIAVETNQIGALRYVRGVTLGRAIASASSQQITPAANGLKPFSPVDVRAARDPATGDIALTWSRRTRLAENFNSSTHPLGEVSEAYAVEIYTTSGFTVLKRTLATVTAPTATYISADQVTDFGSNQATVFVRVYQISATVGRGTPAQVSV